MRLKINITLLTAFIFFSNLSFSADANDRVASDVQVTILSSNLADEAAIGEWGFSALVEADGMCILFEQIALPPR